MTYVVTQACQACHARDCVQVCPQGAFRQGPAYVVIDPLLCANCSLCEMVCPVVAIYPVHGVPADQLHWVQINAERSRYWPVALKA